MKKLIFAASLLSMLLFCGRLQAQVEEKTTETITTVDSATGQTSTTYVTRNSKVENIAVRSNMLVINPLKFFLFYNMSYYHALTPNITVGGGLQMPTLSDVKGFGANAEMRYYLSGKWLRGFYIAPNVSYNHLTSSYTYTDASTQLPVTENSKGDAFSVGALIGWQWFPGDDFAIGLGLGVDKYFMSGDNNLSSTANPLSDAYNGTVPALRFDIGYGW